MNLQKNGDMGNIKHWGYRCVMDTSGVVKSVLCHGYQQQAIGRVNDYVSILGFLVGVVAGKNVGLYI